MSIEIRAKVGRFPKVNTPSLGHIPASWRATVYVHDTEKPMTGVAYGLVEWRSSLPEALQAVQVMRRELNQQLMGEVHASRASRRARRCECPIGMHSINCHEHERNKYTTEATA